MLYPVRPSVMCLRFTLTGNPKAVETSHYFGRDTIWTGVTKWENKFEVGTFYTSSSTIHQPKHITIFVCLSLCLSLARKWNVYTS